CARREAKGGAVCSDTRRTDGHAMTITSEAINDLKQLFDFLQACRMPRRSRLFSAVRKAGFALRPRSSKRRTGGIARQGRARRTLVKITQENNYNAYLCSSRNLTRRNARCRDSGNRQEADRPRASGHRATWRRRTGQRP